MAEFVVRSNRILGRFHRRKTKPVRERAAQEDRKRQKTEEIGCKLDCVTGAFQEAAQCSNGVPPRVARQYVFARPEPLVSRHGDIDPPFRDQEPVDGGQEGGVVPNVFYNIEQANRRESSRQHPGILQSGPHDLTYAAVHGVTNPGKPRFHQHYFEPGLLNRPRDITIAAANIKKCPRRWKELNRLENAAITVTKPERRVFD